MGCFREFSTRWWPPEFRSWRTDRTASTSAPPVMCSVPPTGCRTSSPPTFRAARIWNGRSGAGLRPSTNVEIRPGSVREPLFDARAQRVTGVLLDSPDAAEPQQVDADLVVDAAGRGTRLPVWLEKWGFERPREDTVDVGIGYASQQTAHPRRSHQTEGRRRRSLPRAAAWDSACSATRTASGC